MLAQTLGLLLFTGVAADGSYLGDVLAPSLLVAIGIGLAFVPGDDLRRGRRRAPGGGTGLRAGQHLAAGRRRARAGDPRRDRRLADQRRPAPPRRGVARAPRGADQRLPAGLPGRRRVRARRRAGGDLGLPRPGLRASSRRAAAEPSPSPPTATPLGAAESSEPSAMRLIRSGTGADAIRTMPPWPAASSPERCPAGARAAAEPPTRSRSGPSVCPPDHDELARARGATPRAC